MTYCKEKLCGFMDYYIQRIEYINSNIEGKLQQFVSPKGISNRFFRSIDVTVFGLRMIWISRNTKTDLIVCHDLYVSVPVWIKAKLANATILFDYVEMTYGRFRPRPMNRLSARLLMLTEHLMSNSEALIAGDRFLAKDFNSRHPKAKPIVIHNVVDIENRLPGFDLRAVIGTSDKATVFIYCGLLNEDRGLRTAISAMGLLDDRNHLVILGHGPLAYVRQLQEHARSESTEDRVHLVPPVPHQQIVEICRQADYAISPISGRYGNSRNVLTNKLFEYIAAGLPIVGMTNTAVGEFVETHGIGILSEDDTPEAYANALAAIVVADTTNDNMRENIRSVEQLYNWENESRKLDEVLAGLP